MAGFRISFLNLWFIERRSNISWAGLRESNILLLILYFICVLHNILYSQYLGVYNFYLVPVSADIFVTLTIILIYQYFLSCFLSAFTFSFSWHSFCFYSFLIWLPPCPCSWHLPLIFSFVILYYTVSSSSAIFLYFLFSFPHHSHFVSCYVFLYCLCFIC